MLEHIPLFVTLLFLVFSCSYSNVTFGVYCATISQGETIVVGSIMPLHLLRARSVSREPIPTWNKPLEGLGDPLASPKPR
jgi:hypothetical protein